MRVAATVVSEIKDKLSPKKEPPTTEATIIAGSIPILLAIPEATGIRATIVPTEVPIDKEIMHEDKNKQGINHSAGNIDIVTFTATSIAPISLVVCANAPARTKIQIIKRRFKEPTPFEKQAIRSSIEIFLSVNKANIEDSKKTTINGILVKSPPIKPNIRYNTIKKTIGDTDSQFFIVYSS